MNGVMQNPSKSLLVITAILSLLLDIFLIVRFSVNLSTVIYTNFSDIDVPCPNQTLYLDNLNQNMKRINVSLRKKEKPLSERVSVLCLVITQPKNLRTKAVAVKNAWGRRCNKLLFISSVPDKELPALGFNTTEGKSVTSLIPCHTSMTVFFNPFVPNAPFLYSLKTSENLSVS